MKAILEFNLPDDEASYETALAGSKCVTLLAALRYDLRYNRKYKEDTATTWEDVEEWFWAKVAESGVNSELF